MESSGMLRIEKGDCSEYCVITDSQLKYQQYDSFSIHVVPICTLVDRVAW